MTLVYITCKDKREAEKIARHLLKKRLIACANFFPIKSMYWWNKKIVNEAEYAIIAKTNSNNYKKAANEIRRVHSCKIPCIQRIDANSNAKFERWASKEMK